MIVSARDYTTATASEMRAAAAEIHRRLMNPANRFRPKPAPVTPSEPDPVLPMKSFRLVPAPLWKVSPQQFNEHVVHYRQHMLKLEKAMQSHEDFEEDSPKPSMTQISLEVLQSFPTVTLAELKGSHRNRTIVAARQTAMYQIRYRRPDLSYPVIGRFFGGRDHTTVIHAVKKIERIMRGDAA